VPQDSSQSDVNPSPTTDESAGSAVEVDLSPLTPGQAVTVEWQGLPVFIRNRTPDEIARAVQDDGATMPDPEKDETRHLDGKAQWLVLLGVCTHRGCLPIGQNDGEKKGDYGGWFCPCHASHYDTSGRIRKGPAQKNLEVPDYRFAGDTRIIVGEKPR
jgi:ubiquinol-cytochrome c reductase iron-sulfur subunit